MPSRQLVCPSPRTWWFCRKWISAYRLRPHLNPTDSIITAVACVSPASTRSPGFDSPLLFFEVGRPLAQSVSTLMHYSILLMFQPRSGDSAAIRVSDATACLILVCIREPCHICYLEEFCLLSGHGFHAVFFAKQRAQGKSHGFDTLTPTKGCHFPLRIDTGAGIESQEHLYTDVIPQARYPRFILGKCIRQHHTFPSLTRRRCRPMMNSNFIQNNFASHKFASRCLNF